MSLITGKTNRESLCLYRPASSEITSTPSEIVICCGLRLLVRLLLQLLVDAPLVAEGVNELSVTRAPEHILHRHEQARSSGDSPFHNRVRVVCLQGDAHACPA